MSGVRSVAILLHRRYTPARGDGYRVWFMAELWKRAGVRVDVVRGPAEAITADVLIPHVDLSYIPDEYWEVIVRHPCAVNRHVRDIRKRLYSELIVRRDDAWDGPVIVKTDANSGGYSEELFGRSGRRGRMERRINRFVHRPGVERRLLRWLSRLDTYHVFKSARHVPRGVYDNPLLVVERFMPERREDGYAVRSMTCFGDRVRSRMMVAPEPIVKARNAKLREYVPTPPEMLEWRKRLRVDYGKLDFVVHDGRAVLLDVNITPSMSSGLEEGKILRSRYFAEGLEWFGKGPGESWLAPVRVDTDLPDVNA